MGYPRLCVLMNSIRDFMELWVAVRWVIYFTKIVQSITITSPGGEGTVLELLQCIIYNVISNKKNYAKQQEHRIHTLGKKQTVSDQMSYLIDKYLKVTL